MQDLRELQNADASEDLEAKERRLRKLNEKLENHQLAVVSKAQELIQENVDFLRNSNIGVISAADNITGNITKDIPPVTKASDEDIKDAEEGSEKKVWVTDEVGSVPIHTTRPWTSKDESELADLQLEEDIVGLSRMSGASQVKLHKAKYKAMEKKFNDLVDVLHQKERELVDLTKQTDVLCKDNKKLSRQLSNAQAKVNKAERLAEDSKNQVGLLRCHLDEEKRKLKDFQRLSKERTKKTRTKDIRLNRALEEADRAKKELLASKSDNRSSSTNRIEKISGLQKQNKQLRLEKKQLITAFKKQMKLVDILKRQKLHMEAMKLVSYSEEAFLKLVSQGE